jgi:uncharacterized repeat protein (TIGR03803 family)
MQTISTNRSQICRARFLAVPSAGLRLGEKRFASMLLLLALGGPLKADVEFQALHSFGQAGPVTTPIQANDGNLYGTIPTDASGFSAVYRITTNGIFTVLHSFTNATDGAYPSGLVQAGDGKLYGTTQRGGASAKGNIFQVTPGGAFKVVYSFTAGDDGSGPIGLSAANDGGLIGTTASGGAGGGGTVFHLGTNGILTSLYSFASDCSNWPLQLLQASDGTFYGTTLNCGSVFRLTVNGTLTQLYSFNSSAWPVALVLAKDGNLYGTTAQPDGTDTVFRLTMQGKLTTLQSFPGGSGNPADPNSSQPSLIQGRDGNLYGTIPRSGNQSYGSFFRLSTNGTITTLFSFDGADTGEQPNGVVQARDGSFYGTTHRAGAYGYGTLFRDSVDGFLTTLHYFGSQSEPAVTGGGGSLLWGRDGNLYGTTVEWYTDYGTVFRLGLDGAFLTLHTFSGGADGGDPASLVQACDGNLYGTTSDGWYQSPGTVFRITTSGMLTTLLSFDLKAGDTSGPLLPSIDGALYGTTSGGGRNDAGTVFRLMPDGKMTTLYSFTAGADGWIPSGGLVVGSDGNLYGTTQEGGANTNGTVYRITTTGTLTSLYSFTGGVDGGHPYGLTKAKGGSFYGITTSGGQGDGTLFRISTNGALTTLYSGSVAHPIEASDGDFYGLGSGGGNGSGTIIRIGTNGVLTTVYSFTGGNDGYQPQSLVQGPDGNMYGTALWGGANGDGTVFRLVLSPAAPLPLSIVSPLRSDGALRFSFQTTVGQCYTIEQTADLTTPNWMAYTNLIGDGNLKSLAVSTGIGQARFFRIHEP